MEDALIFDNGSLGCFQQHLFRKYKNPLFPNEEITQNDINMAKERDEDDFKKLMDQWVNYLNTVSNANGTPMPFSEATKDKEKIDYFLMKSLAIGGKADSIYESALKMRLALDRDVETAIGNNVNLLDAHKKAVMHEKENCIPFYTPFFAQFLREDSPIKNCVLPSALSESLDTWQSFIKFGELDENGIDELMKEIRKLISHLSENEKEKFEIKEKVDFLSCCRSRKQVKKISLLNGLFNSLKTWINSLKIIKN
jgi:hypothetical protein